MILVDNNLSYRVSLHFDTSFPGSAHVAKFNMDENTEDITIWKFDRKKGFTIITKDNDYEALSRLYGCPPKVIQLTCGNKTTAQIIAIMGKNEKIIQSFIKDKDDCLLYLQ
jgi:predicted nuclease of predicted toxin-antitoxin system